MFDLRPDNAAEYLAGRSECGPGPWTIAALGGGVSNTVLLAEAAGRRMVLKQSLARLRVEQDWFADRGRIHREAAALRMLGPHLAPGSLPDVLWEDRENWLFAMSAAPASARDWKSRLLGGEMRSEIAVRVAELLACQIRIGRESPKWREQFCDATNFDQLRLDPYYRATAARHPDLAGCFERLIEECRGRRYSLAHGDWSPKNFLVDGDSVMAIDYEVVHFGDPSFDAAFLLNHLALKSFHMPERAAALAGLARRFWSTLADTLPPDAGWFEAATIRHLGALLLARVDGKSPAEYLSAPERIRVREFARHLILEPPPVVLPVFEKISS